MEWLTWMQWPAMASNVIAAWLVGSTHSRRRHIGFWCFLAGNVMWVAWGLHDKAWALVALQFFLVATNLRGVWKNDPEHEAAARSEA